MKHSRLYWRPSFSWRACNILTSQDYLCCPKLNCGQVPWRDLAVKSSKNGIKSALVDRVYSWLTDCTYHAISLHPLKWPDAAWAWEEENREHLKKKKKRKHNMLCSDSHGKLFSIYFICGNCQSSTAVWQLKSLHIHVASWRYFTPTYINHKGRQKPWLDCKTRSQSHGDLWRPRHQHPPACNWEGERRKLCCQRWPEWTGAHWDVPRHVQRHDTPLTGLDELKFHPFIICLRFRWNVLI